jgi:uncharacterized protein (TIGR03067 family)
MRYATSVTVAVVAALAGFAGADDKKTDAEAIRGEWKVVSAKTQAGFDPNEDIAEYKDSVWTFGEKEFTVAKGKNETKLAYRIAPAKKLKEIDLGKNLNGKNEKRPFEGIYELKGDTLRICYTVMNARPTDFSMTSGTAAEKHLIVLERVKKDGK